MSNCINVFRKIYFGQQLAISAIVGHQSQLCFFCFEAEEKGKKFVVKVWSAAAAQYVEQDLNKIEVTDQRLPHHQRWYHRVLNRITILWNPTNLVNQKQRCVLLLYIFWCLRIRSVESTVLQWPVYTFQSVYNFQRSQYDPVRNGRQSTDQWSPLDLLGLKVPTLRMLPPWFLP